jgi:hypothetical protein
VTKDSSKQSVPQPKVDKVYPVPARPTNTQLIGQVQKGQKPQTEHR